MLHVKPPNSSQPRWKAIRRQLETELAQYDYGSRFHTITEVCERFDVSTTTAIRVLTELANDGLIEKIQGRGNIVRRVARGVHVRLLVPDEKPATFPTFDPVIKRLVDGVTEAARRYDVDFNMIQEAHLSRLFPQSSGTYGFLAMRELDYTTRDLIRERHLSVVCIDPLQGARKFPHARGDRVAAGYIATRHLLELGHRRIAWITGPLNLRNFRERLKGYRAALREAGLKFKWNLIAQSDPFDKQSEQEEAALKTMMRLRRPPTAVIVGDDYRGMNTLEACSRLGINVPDDLSVVGYPNYPESALTAPPLTVVDANFEQIGEACLKLLLDQMFDRAGNAQEPIVIQPQLIERASTAPPSKPLRGNPS